MPAIARIGDVAGGPIASGRQTVRAGGVPVACIGDAVSPHGEGVHSGATIATGNSRVLAYGIPVSRIGDTASCGHVIASGQANVQVG